jgi:hypothetical protein
MGILEQIRSKLEIGADVPNSKALTQARNVEQTKLDKKDRDIQAVKDGLALAALGADGGQASTDRLERLGRERTALQAIVDALRTEIATALEAERTAADQAQWDKSAERGGRLLAAATPADAAVRVLVDTLQELKSEQRAFESSLPDRPPGYVSPIASDGTAIALDRIKASWRGDGSVERVSSLEAVAKEEVAIALGMRPVASQESNSAPSADEQTTLTRPRG